MLKGIYGTLTGKYMAQRRLEMVSNNIANSLTPGYKSSKPVQDVGANETPSAEGDRFQAVNSGALNSHIEFTEGSLMQTGGTFDFAIEGDGFFAISTKDGTAYTRNGQFTINKEKKLVTMDGNPVMGTGGEIIIDGKDIVVEGDGSIYVDRNVADKIKVVDFKDKRDLRSAGRSLFVNANSNTEMITPEKYAVRQGYYESSNVDIMKEMINMLSSLRAYESYTKIDQAYSDILTKLNEIGRT